MDRPLVEVREMFRRPFILVLPTKRDIFEVEEEYANITVAGEYTRRMDSLIHPKE